MGSGSLSTGFSGKSITLQQSLGCGGVKAKDKVAVDNHCLKKKNCRILLNETTAVLLIFSILRTLCFSTLQCWNMVGVGRYVYFQFSDS